MMAKVTDTFGENGGLLNKLRTAESGRLYLRDMTNIAQTLDNVDAFMASWAVPDNEKLANERFAATSIVSLSPNQCQIHAPSSIEPLPPIAPACSSNSIILELQKHVSQLNSQLAQTNSQLAQANSQLAQSNANANNLEAKLAVATAADNLLIPWLLPLKKRPRKLSLMQIKKRLMHSMPRP